jgi:rhodanese-related sulfurtransferase
MTSSDTAPDLHAEMTMAEIERAFPSAKRALFQRYHVGGCSTCAYQPDDTLAKMCKDHNILDVPEVIAHVRRSHEVDQKMQIGPEVVRSWLTQGESVRFIDMRAPEEAGQAPVPEAEPLDFANQSKYMEIPKDTRIVFLCTTGGASLDAAAYFAGHGYTQAYAVRGGAEAWLGQ